MTALAPSADGQLVLPTGVTLDHYVCCCDENLSACGLDMSDEPWIVVDNELCVVCDDLWNTVGACLRCGCEGCE